MSFIFVVDELRYVIIPGSDFYVDPVGKNRIQLTAHYTVSVILDGKLYNATVWQMV
jgi:hypothetical protein